MYNYDAGNEDEMSLSKGEIITAIPADEVGEFRSYCRIFTQVFTCSSMRGPARLVCV